MLVLKEIGYVCRSTHSVCWSSSFLKKRCDLGAASVHLLESHLGGPKFTLDFIHYIESPSRISGGKLKSNWNPTGMNWRGVGGIDLLVGIRMHDGWADQDWYHCLTRVTGTAIVDIVPQSCIDFAQFRQPVPAMLVTTSLRKRKYAFGGLLLVFQRVLRLRRSAQHSTIQWVNRKPNTCQFHTLSSVVVFNWFTTINELSIINELITIRVENSWSMMIGQNNQEKWRRLGLA